MRTLSRLVLPLFVVLGLACGETFSIQEVDGTAVDFGETGDSTPPESEPPPSACPLVEAPWTLSLALGDDGCRFASQLSGGAIALQGTPACEDPETGAFSWPLSGDLNTDLTLACTSEAETFACTWTDGTQTLTLDGGSSSGVVGSGAWVWSLPTCTSSGDASLAAE